MGGTEIWRRSESVEEVVILVEGGLTGVLGVADERHRLWVGDVGVWTGVEEVFDEGG